MAQGLERCWWWSYSNGIPINPAQNDGTGFWTMFPCLLHMIQIYDILWCIICICIVYIVYVCSYSLQYLYTHITYFSSSACHVWCQPPALHRLMWRSAGSRLLVWSNHFLCVRLRDVPGIRDDLLWQIHRWLMVDIWYIYIYIWYIMIYLRLLDQLEFRADIS